jgi:hypothetical protein
VFVVVGAGLSIDRKVRSVRASPTPIGLGTSLVLMLFSVLPSINFACSPMSQPVGYLKPPLSEFAERNYASANHVAEIKILSITEKKEPWAQVIRFEVTNKYKGSLSSKGAFVFMRYACDHMFETFYEGQSTVIFLSDKLNSVYERDWYLPHVKSDVEEYVRTTKQPSGTK